MPEDFLFTCSRDKIEPSAVVPLRHDNNSLYTRAEMRAEDDIKCHE